MEEEDTGAGGYRTGVRIVGNAGNDVPRHIDFLTDKSCLKNAKQMDKLTNTNGHKKTKLEKR